MVDSGIILKRAKRLEFWHLSFQEFLAAYEIAGLLDSERSELLFKNEQIYSMECHELVLLLGGILYKQGSEKISHLVNSIIEKATKETAQQNLPKIAREVGLLGGIVRDLSPFEFKPANPCYAEIARSVMGIFEKDTFRKIPVKVRIEAADALVRVGDPRLEGMPVVYIPSGKFWMGAQKQDKNKPNYDEEAHETEDDWIESPVHKVELPSFSISKYPVAVG